MSTFFENFFKLKEHKTSVKTEVLAGITTFMTMAYILVVNPAILSEAGMDKGAVFTTTAIASFVGTVLMALLANYPFALAPGMGLNAYFAYTIVIGKGYSWQFALTAVLLEGIVFLILTFTKVREMIVNAMPYSLKQAVSAGIGIFIAFLGLYQAGLVKQGNTFRFRCNHKCNFINYNFWNFIYYFLTCKKSSRCNFIWYDCYNNSINNMWSF